MADEHIRSSDPRPGEESVQFDTDFVRIPWVRTRIAPTHASSVVSANPCHGRDFRLYPSPIGRHHVRRSIQDHRRTAHSHAMEMKPIPTHIDELARRRIFLNVRSRCDRLEDVTDARRMRTQALSNPKA